MKHILIIEDELPAAEKLIRFVHKYDHELIVHGALPSIEESLKWLTNKHNRCDLILMDIYLADGPCFEIFKQIEIQKPIIFTTAYNEYALEAFQHNSIAYLLKPITYSSFLEGMEQFKQMKKVLSPPNSTKASLLELLGNISPIPSYKSRFMVKSGERIRSILVKDISCFYAEGRTVFLSTFSKRKYIINYTLAELAGLLNPELFFRVNRTYFVHIAAIQEVFVHSNSRLKLALSSKEDIEIIVSRDKVGAFKDWFDGKNGF